MGFGEYIGRFVSMEQGQGAVGIVRRETADWEFSPPGEVSMSLVFVASDILL